MSRYDGIRAHTVTLYPMGDRVLVRCDTADPREGGLLIVPEVVRWDGISGIVIAVGPGTHGERRRAEGDIYGRGRCRCAAGAPPCRPMQICVGQRVWWDKYCGVRFEIDRHPHMVLRVDDIVAEEIQ